MATDHQSGQGWYSGNLTWSHTDRAGASFLHPYRAADRRTDVVEATTRMRTCPTDNQRDSWKPSQRRATLVVAAWQAPPGNSADNLGIPSVYRIVVVPNHPTLWPGSEANVYRSCRFFYENAPLLDHIVRIRTARKDVAPGKVALLPHPLEYCEYSLPQC